MKQEVALCSRHGAFDEADDNHYDTAAHAAAGDAADQRSWVNSAAAGGCAQGLQEHAADAAAENTGDGVPQRPEALILQRRAGNIASDGATDKLDNQF